MPAKAGIFGLVEPCLSSVLPTQRGYELASAETLSFDGVATIPLSDTEDRLYLEPHLIAEARRAPELSAIISNGSGASPRSRL